MKVQQIIHERWQSFFDDFSQLHHGRHVNVETLTGREHQAEPKVRDQPLVGIVMAQDAPEMPERIEVIAGDSPEHQTALCVANPSRVWVARENGWIVALQIQTADGAVTMLRMEPPLEGMPSGYRIA